MVVPLGKGHRSFHFPTHLKIRRHVLSAASSEVRPRQSVVQWGELGSAHVVQWVQLGPAQQTIKCKSDLMVLRRAFVLT